MDLKAITLSFVFAKSINRLLYFTFRASFCSLHLRLYEEGGISGDLVSEDFN